MAEFVPKFRAMERPTVKPPRRGVAKASPTESGSESARPSVPTARIRLTSKEPPALEGAEPAAPIPRAKRVPAGLVEEVTYDRDRDARVDPDE